jgi:uncharacterized YccA/Bax inhibitor family protein
MNSSNPTLGKDLFDRFRGMGLASPADRMTVQGTLNKSILLVLVALVTAVLSWAAVDSDRGFGMALTLVGGVVAFGVAIFTTFQVEKAPITAPVYAAAEGLVLGGISALYSTFYGGIVGLAVPLTLAILFLMLGLYRAGVLRATPVFTRVVILATAGIAVVYLISLVMSLFGFGGLTFLHSPTPLGIGISLLICGVAALNFVLDFDFIERGAEAGAPKYMEWYGAFSLCVTLFWLYLEILRLLSLLNGSRR